MQIGGRSQELIPFPDTPRNHRFLENRASSSGQFWYSIPMTIESPDLVAAMHAWATSQSDQSRNR
jgi:hypothetical protein